MVVVQIFTQSAITTTNNNNNNIINNREWMNYANVVNIGKRDIQN